MKTGKSVFLRRIIPEDLNLLVLWENNPENWKVSGILKPYTLTELKEFVESKHTIENSNQERFMICKISDNSPLGTIDLFDANLNHGFAEVGILIAEASKRNKGYGLESIELLIEFAYEELKIRNLFCSIHADNDSSIRLFKKAGFNQIGVRKDWYLHDGKFIDELLFQICLVK